MIIKKKKKNNILLKLIIIIIVGVFCSFGLINYFSKNISPVFMVYAKDEITRIITIVINDSVNEEIIDEINEDDLFEIIRNNNGEIQLVSYNVTVVNVLLNDIALIVQDNLKLLEEGEIDDLNISNSNFSDYNIDLLKQGIIYEIPFGAFFNNSLIANVGPKIPVKFNLLGDVTTNINTSVKEYGINNALLEVSVEVSVNARVNLPFVSNKINVTNTMPISMKIIQGNIPNFYSGGFNSVFSLINIKEKI